MRKDDAEMAESTRPDIKRGDIFYIHHGPTSGSEYYGGRPAIVVSNEHCNTHSPVVEVIFLTTKKKKPMPTHATIMATGIESTAICEQVTAVSIERLGRHKATASSEEMESVDRAISASLGIEANDSGKSETVERITYSNRVRNSLDFSHQEVYNAEKSERKGVKEMNLQDLVTSAVSGVDMTIIEAGHKLGLTPRQFKGKLTRGTLKASAMLALFDEIGIELSIVRKDTGEKIEIVPAALPRTFIKGAGKRVQQMVHGQIYDTDKADAVSNSFYANGKDMYTDGYAFELYVTESGEYFFAEYSVYEAVRDRIIPIPAADAATFIEKYGTDLHKGHDE